MQTSPIVNTIAPAQTQASKTNDTNMSSDSPNSFNQVLSREMADRKTVNQAPKTKEPEAKGAAKPADAEKSKDAKAASDADASAADTDNTADKKDDAAAATNDMLALVASLNQANSTAQGTQQGAVTDPQAAATQAADIAIDAAVSGAKPAIDKAVAGRGRATPDRTVDTSSQVKDKAAPVVVGAPQAQAAQPEGKTDAASNFAGALNKANVSADAADTREVKPADVTAQATQKQEVVAASTEPVAAAIARQERAADIAETTISPTTLQVAQQSAVNNLTHLAPAQAAEHLAPRVGTPAWDQALGQKVTWMIAGEQQSASLTLNPPDLGPLQVVLNVTNSQANATFVAAQPEVRQALEAAMPRLRDMLSDAGIQLGQATVSSGSNGQQSAFDQQQSSSNSNSHRADVSSVRFDTPVQAGRVQPSSSGLGLVDTFV